MDKDNNNIKALYTSLSKRPEFPKVSYDKFRQDMEDENHRRNLHESLSKRSYFPKISYEQFSKDLGFEDKGFWGTWTGDLLEGMGGTALNIAGNFMDAVSRLNPVDIKNESERREEHGNKKGYEIAEAERLAKAYATPFNPLSGLKIAGEHIKKSGKELTEKSNDYYGTVTNEDGTVRNKDFTDLWKEGKYGAALGNILLEGGKSTPTSAAAMSKYGLPVIGIAAANEKYDETSRNTDTGMGAAALNAVATGAFEALTEKVGAGIEKRILKNIASKKGKDAAVGAVKDVLFKYFKSLPKEAATEGLEEGASQIAVGAVDYLTGLSNKPIDFEDVGKAIAYGAGGGMFGGGTMGGAVTAVNIPQAKRYQKFKEQKEKFEAVKKDGEEHNEKFGNTNSTNKAIGRKYKESLGNGKLRAVFFVNGKQEEFELTPEEFEAIGLEEVDDISLLDQEPVQTTEQQEQAILDESNALLKRIDDEYNNRINDKDLSDEDKAAIEKEAREKRAAVTEETQRKIDALKQGNETVEQEAEQESDTEQEVEDLEKIAEIKQQQEKEEFIRSLPRFERGKNKGEIDESQLTPEQKIQYFEYEFTDETLEAVSAHVEIKKKEIEKEVAKLAANPMSIAQRKKVKGLKQELQTYEDYVKSKTESVDVQEAEGQEATKKQEEQDYPFSKKIQEDNEPKIGVFGKIYTQFKGKAKDAIAFLTKNKEGVAVGALNHNEVGDIDLVWGTDKYGLKKIAEKHPEMLDGMQDKISKMKIKSSSDNRIVLENNTHKAIVSRNAFGEEHNNWLLTAYEKKNTASASSIDNETEPVGNRIDTAPPKNGVSADKDTQKSDKSVVFTEKWQKRDKKKNASEAEITAKIEEIQAKSSNPIKVEFVDTESLPEHIKNHPNFSENWDAVNGGNGVVYFKKGSVRSIDEAVAKWIHEVGIHSGINNLLSKEQKAELMTKVYNSALELAKTDATYAKLVEHIENNYKGADAAVKGEEVLAYLAEKVVSEKDLRPVDKTMWQKVVELFRESLNKVFGNGSNLLTDKEITQIIHASVQSNFISNEYADSNEKRRGNLRQEKQDNTTRGETNTGKYSSENKREGWQSGVRQRRVLSEMGKDVTDKEKNINFAKNKSDDRTEARLDNSGTVERSTLDKLVGELEKRDGAYRTIQASNSGGSESPILTVEEREELESRGINPFWNKSKFRQTLKEQAQKNGVWLGKSFLDNKTLIHDQKANNTSENDVYLNEGGKTLTKVNNLVYANNQEYTRNLAAFIDRLNAHNSLFPEVAYTIKGFTENKNGVPSMVLEQPFVEVERNATQEEIKNFLESKGFKLSGTRDWSNGHKVWSNGKYELYDARPANVVVDKGGDLRFIDAYPHSVAYMSKNSIKDAESSVETKPTEKQKEAGNYKKGHVKVFGFDITIEQPKGSTRSGVDENGKRWWSEMKNTYGYFKGTKGKDGDHIDVFLSDNLESDKVFVVDQINPKTKEFDEHKVMLGFNSEKEARKAYLSNYEKNWQGLGNITETDVKTFKEWASNGRKKQKEFAEYKSLKFSKENFKNYKFDNENNEYYVRWSEHIEDDLKRGWSSWNFGEEGFEGTREDLDKYLEEITDDKPFFISGFEVWPHNVDEFEFGELYPGYWVAIDNENAPGGLSAHYLPSDLKDLKGALKEIETHKGHYDGTGDGEYFYASDASVIYSDENGMNILEVKFSKQSIEKVNERFNDDLDRFDRGEMKPHETFNLGYPLDILQSAGLKNQPVILSQKTLSSHLKKHDLKASEIKGLVKAIQKPLLVYEWGTKASSTVIITDLTLQDGRKITTAVKVNRGGKVSEINEIASVYGKSAERFLSDMEKAKEGGLKDALRYVGNKAKALEWLNIAPPKGAIQSTQRLSAAKIIQNFENPKINNEKSDIRFSKSTEEKQIEQEAKANGTYMKAPNGKPTKLNERQWLQARTKAFKKWFGDWEGDPENASKVVDENGEPLVVYHGTGADFHKFDPNKQTTTAHGYGFYFATEKYVAKGYTGGKDNGRVMNSYLFVKNPLSETDSKFSETKLASIIKEIVKLEMKKYKGEIDSYKDSFLSNITDTYSVTEDEAINEAVEILYDGNDTPVEQIAELSNILGDRQMVHQAVKNTIGNDGIYVKDFQEVDGDVYIAWFPSQIKSATDNTGTFDSGNDDIRFSKSGLNWRKDKTLAPIKPEFTNDYPGGLTKWLDDYRKWQQLNEEWQKEQYKYIEKSLEYIFDTYNPLKKLQKVVEEKIGRKLTDDERGYEDIMRMSSQADNQSREFKKKYYEPLINEAVGNIIKNNTDIGRKDVSLYLIAKHAIERNAFMRQKEIEDYKKSWINDRLRDWKKRLKAEKITDREYNDKKAEIEDKAVEKANIYAEKIKHKVYAGIKTQEAQEVVDAFEAKVDKKLVDNLWKKVNAATDYSLDMQLKTGLLSQKMYDYIKSMYTNYVPLVGWDEKTAADVFDYGFKSAKSSLAQMKKASQGRESLPDDPLVYIRVAATTAITNGLENKARLSVLNMMQNNPDSSLYYVDDMYYINNGTEENPDYQEMSGEPTKADLLSGRAVKMRPIGHKATPAMLKEHQVEVWKNGEKVIMRFVDPKIAQAIRGDNKMKLEGKFFDATRWCTRALSRNFTSRNPEFILSNSQMDIGFSWIMNSVKYGTGQAFIRNMPKCTGAAFTAIFKEKKFDPKNNEMHRHFQDFLDEGGETGFLGLKDIEAYKSEMERMLKTMEDPNAWVKMKNKGMDALDFIEKANRLAEDLARFTTYYTVRTEKGFSKKQAAVAAKEISINFNRRGIIAPIVAPLFVFFNAALQGVYNFLGSFFDHPEEMAVVGISFAIVGFLFSELNRLIGGVNEAGALNYYDFHEYTRKTNFMVVWNGRDHGFRLPHILRGFYGWGVGLSDYIHGKKEAEQLGFDMVADMVNELSPVDVSSPMRAIQPSVLQPFLDNATNRNFANYPIYKEPYGFEKSEKPQWQMAANSTNDIFVWLSKMSNRIGGGTDSRPASMRINDKGEVSYSPIGNVMDWNPSKIEHLVEYFGGGVLAFLNRLGKTSKYAAIKIAGGDAHLNANDIPLLRTFYKTTNFNPDVEYFKAKKKINRFSDYLKKADEGSDDYKRLMSNEAMKNNADDLKETDKEVRKLYKKIKESKDPNEMIEFQHAKQQFELNFLKRYHIRLNGGTVDGDDLRKEKKGRKKREVYFGSEDRKKRSKRKKREIYFGKD